MKTYVKPEKMTINGKNCLSAKNANKDILWKDGRFAVQNKKDLIHTDKKIESNQR